MQGDGYTYPEKYVHQGPIGRAARPSEKWRASWASTSPTTKGRRTGRWGPIWPAASGFHPLSEALERTTGTTPEAPDAPTTAAINRDWLPDFVRRWMVLSRASRTEAGQAAVARSGNKYDLFLSRPPPCASHGAPRRAATCRFGGLAARTFPLQRPVYRLVYDPNRHSAKWRRQNTVGALEDVPATTA